MNPALDRGNSEDLRLQRMRRRWRLNHKQRRTLNRLRVMAHNQIAAQLALGGRHG